MAQRGTLTPSERIREVPDELYEKTPSGASRPVGLTNLHHAIACNKSDEPKNLSGRQQRAKGAWVHLYSMRWFVDWTQKVGLSLAHPWGPRAQNASAHIEIGKKRDKMFRAGFGSVTKAVVQISLQVGLTTKVCFYFPRTCFLNISVSFPPTPLWSISPRVRAIRKCSEALRNFFIFPGPHPATHTFSH